MSPKRPFSKNLPTKTRAGIFSTFEGSISKTLPALLALLMGTATTAIFAASDPALPPPSDHAQRMSKGLESFDQDIRKILSGSCLKCHGGEKVKGEFDLGTREALLKGGTDGPSVVAFHPDKSRILKMLRHEEEPFMPEKKPKLPEDMIEKIASWIKQGAPYSKSLTEGKTPERDRSKVTDSDRSWWSFQPLAPVPIPSGSQAHPIDRFLAHKAAEKKLELAPKADRRTLIRRATLDLTGLPPTPEEVERFVGDSSPGAWPKLIDSLLSRPAYGERWARHWMDVARYGESSGFEQDYDRTGSYHYRDFLIQALNENMPFQQFVQWQIAGDEFAPGNPKALAATAFLGLGVFPTQITINELERVRYEDMDDMLSTTGTAFLGLTVGCARCHDHKYDPIPTKDYYRMLSTFTGTVRSEVDLDTNPEQTGKQTAEWKRELENLLTEQTKLETSLHPAFETFLERDIPTNVVPNGWMVLHSLSAQGTAGTTFTPQEDGSLLANKGKDPTLENFEFSCPAPSRSLTGLRLEALVDPSLPATGPGRSAKGNFQLTKVRVEIQSADGTRTSVPFSKAVADFEQNKESLSVASVLTGKPDTGWSIGGKEKASHTAAFTFAEAITPAPGATLEVTLEFQGNGKGTIGRPRLAVMSGEAPGLAQPTVEAKVYELLASQMKPESAENLHLLERWWRTRDTKWKTLENKRVALEKTKPNGLSKVLVASESYPAIKYHTAGGSVETYKDTFVLKRGNVALKEEVATPGFLQVLSRSPEERWQWTPPTGAKYAGKRRGLATWILDEKQGAGALASRVFVNRLWLHHFGRGLVQTPNDFGKTGTLPVQPEMLDWLSGQLLQNGGDIKAMHRLMMTSDAYQQAAAKDPAKEATDPANDLFARSLPRRLEGEAIRDSLLAVAGILDPTLFGPSIKDENSRRRSVYLRVKRSQLMSSMVSFDQPEPLASQGLRPTTTVAPQALVLMNSVQVRTCAKAFADRITEQNTKDSTPENLVRAAYLRALSREPLPGESEDARRFLKEQAQRSQGSSPAETSSAALTDFCQVLLELNEFAYRP